MPKRPARSKSSTSKLLEAIKFVSLAASEESHLLLASGYALASNDFCTLAHPIAEDIFAAPNAKKFAHAIASCGQELSIAQLPNGNLSLSSAKAKFTVACVDPATIFCPSPDAQIALLNDTLRPAFEACAIAEHIFIGGPSFAATDRMTIVEYWHGISLPPLVLPRKLATMLKEIKSPLIGFGFCDVSATFYFENKGWLRTKLVEMARPDFERILNVPSTPVDLPTDFWQAVTALEPMSADGHIRFNDGSLVTDEASYETGVKSSGVFSAKRLLAMKDYIKAADFQDGVCYFFGEKVRGAIAGIR